MGVMLRMVESQELVATCELVKSLSEQVLLEQMIERSKPPAPVLEEGLQYLLYTPFRYPPLKHGSRFGRRHEPSLFYAAKTERTLLYECAYYRFVFWSAMTIPPRHPILTQHTQFTASYAGMGFRLQDHPFVNYRHVLRDPCKYDATQSLGTAMRKVGVQVFEYESARDPDAGLNVGLFTPEALISKKPSNLNGWLCQLTDTRVVFSDKRNQIYEFDISQFQFNGTLPRPA